jgi:hypothetical protein
MFTPHTILVSLTAAATATVSAEHLRVVFSGGSFSFIGGTGTYDGFAILRDNGDAIYNDDTPNDRSPCFSTGGRRTFTIDGDCWNSPREFNCLADAVGEPMSVKLGMLRECVADW